MKRFKKAVGLALLFAFVASGVAVAQGIPTGRLSGRVSDAEGNGVPGVSVEVSSAALQGVRTTVTDLNGDYVMRDVPAGASVGGSPAQDLRAFLQHSARARRKGAGADKEIKR